MRTAVITDVHANLEALTAVLNDARRRGAVRFAGLGDFIGFNGDPAACMELIHALPLTAVRGNHEQAMTERGLLGAPIYTTMLDRTMAMLSAEDLRYLSSLSLTAVTGGVRLVHANPATPGEWQRLATLPDARASFAAFREQICFFGHSHRCTAFLEKEGKVRPLPIVYDAEGTCTIPLEEDCRYLINPGAVGQPRDLDPRAAYAILDREAQTISLYRVEYDTAAAAEKISRTGLPEHFAEALMEGTSPTGD